MRIAFFAPLSPMRGGVVDFSEELLPHLGEHGHIDVYTRDGLRPTNQALAERFHIRGHGEFLEQDRREPYDQVVYQLGCSSDHVPDYENLLKRPGLCVLHELNLAGIIGAQTFGRRRPQSYVKAVLDNEGPGAALSVMWRFVRARAFPDYLKYDFSRVAVRHSQGLIVHNDFMRRNLAERLDRWRIGRPIYPVRMGVRPAPAVSAEQARRARIELGFDESTFVLGSFGVVHESKGILTALLAFQRLLERIPNAVYLLVGQLESHALPQTIRDMGLSGRVKTTGYVEMADYYRYAAAIDVGINLRVPQTGGTSAALLRLLSVGRPVIVSKHAQFAEIPDEICLKADVGDQAENSVLAHLLGLRAQPERAQQIGDRARRYISEWHSLEQAARACWEAIQGSVRIQAKRPAKILEPSPG